MKSLIIYYSLEGNSKFISEAINETLKGDIVRIETVKPVPDKGFFGKYLYNGIKTMLKAAPEIKPLNIDFSKYDLIVFGTPVWAGTYAPVFNTFFEKFSIKNKKILLFCCHGGGGPSKTFKVFAENLKENEILGNIQFKDPLKHNKDAMAIEAKEWVNKFI